MFEHLLKLTFGVYHEECYLLSLSIQHRLSMVCISYKINDDLTITYDQMVFFSYQQKENAVNNIVNIREVRPRQSITYHPKPFGKWSFKYRFMIEKRFKQTREDEKFREGYKLNYRFRYRILGVKLYTFVSTEKHRH